MRIAPSNESISEVMEKHAFDLYGRESLNPLMDRIGDARFVLLGEASHGTSEFYRWRTEISRRLIEEKGFTFIAVEGDWPDCFQLNRYVKGEIGGSGRDVVHGFDRWPTWMWANWEVVAMAEWLRRHNQDQSLERMVGFYGLDVYSLWESLDAIHSHLSQYHPDRLSEALEAMNCLARFNREGQAYAWHTRMIAEDCEEEVVSLLTSLQNERPGHAESAEAHFDAEQNALVAVDAEHYYRAMVGGGPESWNVRDRHMADTLDRLMEFHGPKAKAIVWEHNTHIGDARATDMLDVGMLNVGQLARERHGDKEVVLVGFGTYQGSVIAADEWGAPMQKMQIPPARSGSWESFFHQANPRDKLLILDHFTQYKEMNASRAHRAIGVVYHPDQEMYGNYVPTDLLRRYDAFLHLDLTTALHPLHFDERSALEPPETYPWGV